MFGWAWPPPHFVMGEGQACPLLRHCLARLNGRYRVAGHAHLVSGADQCRWRGVAARRGRDARSTTSSGYLLNRIGLGRLLAASSLLAAVALVLSAARPPMGLLLVSVVLLGLSGGAIDAPLNAYAARNFGLRRINFLHASYGVGAATSPLIVTAVVQTGPTWRWAYAIVAVLQLALAMVFSVTHRRWAAAFDSDGFTG